MKLKFVSHGESFQELHLQLKPHFAALYMYLHYALFKNSDHDMRVAQIDEVIRELHVTPKSQFGR